MQFQFSFKHMESSPALQTYAQEKINEKIQKFASKPTHAHVIFSVDRHQHRAHLSLKGGDGFTFEVEHTCGDMYGSIDMLVDKFGAQLKNINLADKKHMFIRGNFPAGVKFRVEFKQSNITNSKNWGVNLVGNGEGNYVIPISQLTVASGGLVAYSASLVTGLQIVSQDLSTATANDTVGNFLIREISFY